MTAEELMAALKNAEATNDQDAVKGILIGVVALIMNNLEEQTRLLNSIESELMALNKK